MHTVAIIIMFMSFIIGASLSEPTLYIYIYILYVARGAFVASMFPRTRLFNQNCLSSSSKLMFGLRKTMQPPLRRSTIDNGCCEVWKRVIRRQQVLHNSRFLFNFFLFLLLFIPFHLVPFALARCIG